MSAANLHGLVEAASAITSIGHGLHLDEPVNAGSLVWANSAFALLEKLAKLEERGRERHHEHRTWPASGRAGERKKDNHEPTDEEIEARVRTILNLLTKGE